MNGLLRACRPWAVVAGGLLVGAAHAVTITNGVPLGTLGHWSVDVEGGGQTRTGNVTAVRQDTNTLTSSEIVYDYFTYLVIGGTGLQLPTSGAALDGSGNVVSIGSVIGQNGRIDWTASSSIAPGSGVMVNTFTFTSAAALGNLSLFQYLDEDVSGAGDDVFFTRGSAAGGNLELFTIDNLQAYGVSHSGAFSAAQGLVNASFTGWAVDNYNDMKGRILAGGQTVSPTGVFEAGPTPTNNPYVGAALGPIDIVSVMAWTVDPTSNTATIITTLGGVPDITVIPPDDPGRVSEPGALALAGLSLLAAAAARRRRA